MQSPFAGSLQILIDPVSLQVLGTQQAMTGWVRFFHDLHGHLFISGGLGRELVGWLGVGLLFLGCSGLYLWWPRPGQWKAAFMVRRKARREGASREAVNKPPASKAVASRVGRRRGGCRCRARSPAACRS